MGRLDTPAKRAIKALTIAWLAVACVCACIAVTAGLRGYSASEEARHWFEMSQQPAQTLCQEGSDTCMTTKAVLDLSMRSLAVAKDLKERSSNYLAGTLAVLLTGPALAALATWIRFGKTDEMRRRWTE